METTRLDPERYFQFLKDQAKLIREQTLDENQIELILGTIKHVTMSGALARPIKDLNLASEAIFDLNLALQIAYSNYRRENKNLWGSIFGVAASKLPSFDPKQFIK